MSQAKHLWLSSIFTSPEPADQNLYSLINPPQELEMNKKKWVALCTTWCTASSSFCCVSSISFSTSLNISFKVNWPRATCSPRVSLRSRGLFWSAFTRLIVRDMRVRSSIVVVGRDSFSLTSERIEGKLTKGRKKKLGQQKKNNPLLAF